MDTVFTSCEHCAERFEAPTRSAGGVTNCTICGLATAVPGGTDVLWNATIAFAVLGTVVLVAFACLAGGPPMGALTFIGCCAAAFVVRISA